MKQSLFHRQQTKQGHGLEPDKENTDSLGCTSVEPQDPKTGEQPTDG